MFLPKVPRVSVVAPFPRLARFLLPATLAIASLTCGGDGITLPNEGRPAALVVVGGQNQSGTVGMVLGDTLIIRVTDTKDRPVVDARVTFQPGTNGAGADLIPDTAISDADGLARARWVLGTTSGIQTATARVVGAANVNMTFTATAQPDAPDSVALLRGDNQSATAGAPLADSLVVRVMDQYGNPVSGVQVDWSQSGGGSVDPTSTTTGPSGEAATARTLGGASGAQTTTASVTGLKGSPVTFTHTALAGGPTALLKVNGDNQTAPAGTFAAESLVVRLVDNMGNGVAGRAIAFIPTAGSGTASPPSVTTDATGRAASRWTLGGTAGAQTLIASGSGFSATFNATATSDVPTQMNINGGNNQTAAAGTAVNNPPSVRVRDANNNVVANVSVTFTVTGGGGTVAGPSGSGVSTVVATGANGVATLTSWTLGNVAGPNSLSATANGPGGPLSGSPLTFNATGTAGAAAQLVITTQPPGSATSGSTLSTSPVVQLQDALGNPVSQSGVSLTVSLASGNGTLSGTTTRTTNSSGQATFTGLTITGLVGSYTLSFTAGGLTGATSAPITLAAGPASRLVLTTQPSGSAQSGVAFAQQPVVQIEDVAGNPIATGGVVVTASIATGGGTLNGTTTATTNAGGTATFTNLSITGSSGPRTLSFTAPGLTGVTSNTVTIGAGGATRLGFGVQPSNTVAGGTIAPAVTVLVQDASGNTVSGASNAVTLALGSNPGGGTLGGTLTVNAVNGVATFPDLTLDRSGTGYTLAATSPGLTGTTSTAFNVTPGSATQLVFTQQPSNVVAGASIAPAVTVTAQDALGNTVTSYAVPISMSLGNNPGGGTLTGGAAVTPVNGVATFAGLSINRTGNGYTLVATSSTLTRISTSFNVTPGTATQLVFTQQPSSSVAGSTIAPPIQIAIRDALGNTVTTATTAVTLAIGTNPPGNGILSGTTTVNAVAGIATFSNLSIDKPGTGYTLTANGGGLPAATSANFDITVGSGNKLVFLTQPSNVVVGQANSPAIQVQIQDAVGNPVGGTNQITLVSSGPPITGNVVNAVNGVATFSNLRATQTGTGVTLTALASGLLSATSSAFDVAPATTTTTITSDNPDPSVVGRNINVVYSVTVNGPGSGTPTGIVTVTDGTVSCQSTVGAGTCQLAPTTAGAKTLVATYAGDGNFTGSSSSGTPHQVNKASTTTVLNQSSQNSVVGEPVTMTWTVNVVAPGNGTPTGTVTVSSGPDNCSAPVGAGQCDLVLTSPGAKTITAVYGGDADFNGSQDTENHTVTKAATSTMITADTPDPSAAGQSVPVAFTVVATAPGSGTPTGNVTVSDGTNSCVATVAAGTCNLMFTMPGAKTITATYAGDANFSGSSDTEPHDVTVGSTTTTITGTAPSSSVTGQSVTVSYSVIAPAGGTPTGNVTVTDGVGGSCVGTVAGGSCAITFAGAGARTLVATYGGDGNFSGSASAGFGHQVNAAATTTSITADTPDPSTVGQAYTVSYSVAVTAPGGGTPTGSVQVSDGTDACVGTVAAGSCALTSSTTGSKTLTASYLGDANYTGSTSAGVPHTVNLAATTTAITGHTPDPSGIGQAVAVTFTVTSGGGTPTGNVTVTDGVDSCIGTVAAGTCNLTLNTSGTRTLTASYAGDANFSGSTSPGVSHTVNLTATTTTITGNAPNPSTVGQSVTVNVTVSGGSTPTGNVTVGDGTTSCNLTLSGGAGSCALAFPTAGSRTLTATYAGDATHAGSSSAGVNQQVNQAATVTTITGHTPDPSGIGQAVAVTFTVTSGGGTPTGNVTVTDGVDSCIGTVAAGTCNLTLNTTGTRTLTASYAGDANFSGSSSPGVSHTVNLTATTTTITSHTPDPSVVGQGIVIDVTVTSGNGTPAGSVTVSDGTDTCPITLSGGSGSCTLTPTTAGAKTLVATYAGGGSFAGSTSAGVAHQVDAFGAVSPSQSSVTVGSNTLTASTGSSATTITVTARDGFGNLIPGATVVLAVAGGTGNNLVQPAGTTDGAGQAQGSFSATGAGGRTISATVNGVGITQTQAVTVNPDVIDPAASTAVVPGGTAGVQTTITVQARDQFGNPITSGGATVVVTISGANTDTAAITDNGDGTYTATYTPVNTGTDTVDITVNGTPVQGSPFSSAVS